MKVLNSRHLVIASILLMVLLMSHNQGLKESKWEPPEMFQPDDNPMSDASVQLGGALFFETLLSRDSTLSCQSCHLLTEAFADHLPVGMGIKERTVTRNTPTLINIGFHPYFMADGKFASLEDQVIGPVNDHREFDMNAEEVVKRLKGQLLYDEMSQEAYKSELSFNVIQKALANFQRAIVYDNSKFDRYMKGEEELTSSELKGWNLFQSTELNCTACHSGYNFTNYGFENNGFFQEYPDSGRFLISADLNDIGKFKIPTLRNIAVTYPYMHNGTVNSLEEIVDQYSEGGSGFTTQSELIKGFELSNQDRSDVVAFLKTLTDEAFLVQDGY